MPDRVVSNESSVKMVKKPYKKKYKKTTKQNVGWEAMKKINKLERQLKKSTEVKFLDISFAGTLVALNTLVHLSAIAQNVTTSTRIGEQIISKYVKINWDCLITASQVSSIVRMILFTFNGPTTPTVLNVLESSSYLAAYQKNPPETYKVLYDEQVIVQQAGPQREVRSQSIQLNNMLTTFTGTAAANIGKNSVYLLILSDQIVNPTGLSYYVRYAFTDD